MMKPFELKDGKAYIFGHRVHHLEAGLFLLVFGWLLVLHDWLVERRKLDVTQ